MKYHKYDNPHQHEERAKECRAAYEKVSEWKEWETWYEPEDIYNFYVRSEQSWIDLEDGDFLLTLNDFQLAKEYIDDYRQFDEYGWPRHRYAD